MGATGRGSGLCELEVSIADPDPLILLTYLIVIL